MKPAAFEFHRPSTVEEATALLCEHGDEAKVIAGGQSLVPLMNFRLARPSVLVDIGGIDELRELTVLDDGRVRVGALVRHLDLERNALGGPMGALLAATARHVGHLPIRTRGTFGGSLVHADPAAEWPILVRTLGGVISAAGRDRRRDLDAGTFFRSVFTTALDDDEVLCSVTLPALDHRHRFGVAEFARRAGDFAVVAAITVVEMSDDERVVSAKLGLGGVAATPVRVEEAERRLIGRALVDDVIDDAAAIAAASVDPVADIHGDEEYRRALVHAMATRALQMAAR